MKVFSSPTSAGREAAWQHQDESIIISILVNDDADTTEYIHMVSISSCIYYRLVSKLILHQNCIKTDIKYNKCSRADAGISYWEGSAAASYDAFILASSLYW